LAFWEAQENKKIDNEAICSKRKKGFLLNIICA
jgi:hypothetical protein